MGEQYKLSDCKLPWTNVWVTGASQGIGRSLTMALAAAGVNVIASARGIDNLQQLVADSAELSGDIHIVPLDVTDYSAVLMAVEAIEASWGKLDLAVLNAGTYLPMKAIDFDCYLIQKQMELNVMGVCHCIEPLMQLFKQQGQGHIAINASLAGYRGLPNSGGYGASKAALINLAESMRVEIDQRIIKIQVINPGFVKTPLTDKNTFPMPFLMDSDKAAHVLIKGLQSSRFEIRFPFGFGLIMGVLKHLPLSLYNKIIGRLSV
ncbi:MAG: SDR family NAD(P)-dependent oxidoreductase [Endozoicomonas sp. (ex Botrylloides leachii)]|nr:SDR family NAD(P)-dependent oxidoreductase [Endozoicomonas sp. (ex Botrylloides leachii)]